MATVKILRDCVVAHQRRLAGEMVEMDEYTARRLADEQPETFAWVDRPVRQFVDVQPAAPVSDDVVKMPARRPARKLKKIEGVAVEADDGDESTG